ncbi:hypothetical protein Hanom_Chr04g00310931 [Helianthus anomalus]
MQYGGPPPIMLKVHGRAIGRTAVQHGKSIKTEQNYSISNSGILESFAGDFEAPKASAFTRIQATLPGFARLLSGFLILCLFMVR